MTTKKKTATDSTIYLCYDSMDDCWVVESVKSYATSYDYFVAIRVPKNRKVLGKQIGDFTITFPKAA